MKTGTQIIYVPTHANGDEDHPDAEPGFVTSISGDCAYCRFWLKHTPGDEPKLTCDECGGSGAIVVTSSPGFPEHGSIEQESCPACSGEGDWPCWELHVQSD
jgi:hypothetical protein